MKIEPLEPEYFIGIGLPFKENAFFSELKLQLSATEHLNSPPHITLKPPFFHRNESYLIEKLAACSEQFDSFTVLLSSVGSFTHKRNSTVFLASEKPQELKKIERAISDTFSFLPQELDFLPHLTLAQRVDHQKVAQIKKTIRDTRLVLDLKVKNINLYKRMKPGDWIVFKQFPLRKKKGEGI